MASIFVLIVLLILGVVSGQDNGTDIIHAGRVNEEPITDPNSTSDQDIAAGDMNFSPPANNASLPSNVSDLGPDRNNTESDIPAVSPPINASIPLNVSPPSAQLNGTSTLPTPSNTSTSTTNSTINSNATAGLNLTGLMTTGRFPDTLPADQRLLPNQSLISHNRQYVARMSPICSLEILRVHDGSVIWRSPSNSTEGPCSAMMYKSGILSVLDRNLHQIWRSDSNPGQEPSTLRLSDTGNLTITDMMLSSLWKTDPDWRPDHLNGGDTISDPQALVSSNRIYNLQITNSCQLAIRKQGLTAPIWSSSNITTTSPVSSATTRSRCRLSLDKRGVLSLISDGDAVVWSNNYTAGIGDQPFLLRLLPNGTLLETSSQIPIWLVNQNGIASLL